MKMTRLLARALNNWKDAARILMLFAVVFGNFVAPAYAKPSSPDDKKVEARKPYTEAELVKIEKECDALKYVHAMTANQVWRNCRMSDLRKDVGEIRKDIESIHGDMESFSGQILLLNKDGDTIARLDLIKGKLVKTVKLMKQADIALQSAECRACQLLCQLDKLHDAITIGNIISFGAGFGLGMMTGGSTTVLGGRNVLISGPVPGPF